MKFPVSMLRQLVQTQLNAEELGDLLTMAGFELEGIEEVEGEPILDIKVVSNRGDGLSVFGLAREVLAKDPQSTPTDLYELAASRFPRQFPAEANAVKIETDACTRYACIRLENVRVVESPEWLKTVMTQAGWRPINLFVDLTNFVMLELGQPLHAFDLDTLKGQQIVVREAKPGEKLTTLNGVEHELQPHQMMICDAERPIAAAGVMGGLDTEVTESTTRILLESAHFKNTSVRRTRKDLGLSTEASYRFERSVDPEGVTAALNRYADLLQQVGAPCEIVDAQTDAYPYPPFKGLVRVRMSRARKLLGMEVTDAEAKSYLERLGFTVENASDGFTVTSPSWRPDIQREDDLVEEIGRIHGFDRIPESLPMGHTIQGGMPPQVQRRDALRALLLKLGFDQCVSHTLRAGHALDAGQERIGPRSPGSPDIALLRNSTLPSLAEAARRGGGKDFHLFEMGKAFWREAGEPVEANLLGILSQGALWLPNRGKEPVPTADFYTMKAVLAEIAPGIEIALPSNPDPRFHPTRQASLPGIGIFGQLHPDAAEAAGLPSDTVAAELDVDALLAASETPFVYRPISRNPAVRRDLALVVSKEMPFSQIQNALDLACGDLLESTWLFDVYEGAGIPAGKHSLAIALTLRKQGENFTDEEANQVRERAVAALSALGASLRS